MIPKPKRPVLRYHGGKWRTAPWIISKFPEHVGYTEVYCGAASVLLRKPRVNFEVINDLFLEISNLFGVLQDPDQSTKLISKLMVTPFSRDEFQKAYEEATDPADRARALIIRSLMGHGSSGIYNRSSGFRSRFFRTNTHPARDFKNYPDSLIDIIERIRGVVVENKPAIEVLERYDGPKVLHYVDPPYPLSTRNSKHKYAYEMTEDEHRDLAEVLKSLKGMVVLSSYPSDLYREIYQGWHSDQLNTRADGNKPRTEILWFNDSAWAGQKQLNIEGVAP